MKNEPKFIRLLSQGKYCCEITKDEIRNHYTRIFKDEFEMNWFSACKYLSKYTDDAGNCTVEMEDLFDGNTLDQIRSITAYMIFTAIFDIPSKNSTLPRYVYEHGISYMTTKLFELEYAIYKEKRRPGYLNLKDTH